MSITMRILSLAGALLLAACSGTIQRESNAGSQRIAGSTYSTVDVVLTDAARKLQGDNPQFSARELGDYVRRRLEANSLLDAQSTKRVEITIESFRVRSAAAAVLLGIMAGTDQIDGYVRVYDARGRQVHGYKVAASYGLGGWGGGQDGMRMNWLYDKFSELAVAELGGTTAPTAVAKGRAQSAEPAGAAGAIRVTSISSPLAAAPAMRPVAAVATAPQPLAPAVASPPAQATLPSQAAPTASGYAAIDDVDAIPYLSDRGRDGYRDWLAKGTPRAFALAPNGRWAAAWGTKPRDPGAPVDAAARAVWNCERGAQVPCKLYAVNNAVVWVRDAAPSGGAAVPAGQQAPLARQVLP